MVSHVFHFYFSLVGLNTFSYAYGHSYSFSVIYLLLPSNNFSMGLMVFTILGTLYILGKLHLCVTYDRIVLFKFHTTLDGSTITLIFRKEDTGVIGISNKLFKNTQTQP